jgi:hypothetical protein
MLLFAETALTSGQAGADGGAIGCMLFIGLLSFWVGFEKM